MGAGLRPAPTPSPVKVGVQPEIAQTLVGLGVDLHGITTRSTLAAGLQEALRVVRRRLAPIDAS